MKRVQRWLLNLAAAVSLALCMASITAWVLSRHTPMFFSIGSVNFSPQYGQLWMHWQTPFQPASPLLRSHFLVQRRFALVTFFKTDNVINDPSGTIRNVRSDLWVPLWELAATFSLVPLAWLWIRYRSNQIPPGLCPTCGYDLRATPDRCPECGHKPRSVRDASHGAPTA